MKLIRLFALLLVPAAALAQFTTVTGTVVDPNGLPYAFGTIVPLLILPGNVSPTLNGQVYLPPSQASGLAITGFFTMRLADNTVLLPGGTTWNFTVCSGGGTVQPAIGKGSVCFSLAAPITISGASQDISTQLNAVALALTLAGAAVGPGTLNTIAKFTGINTIGNSSLVDNGTDVLEATEDIQDSDTPTAATFNGITENAQYHSFFTSTATSGNEIAGFNQVGNINPGSASSASYFSLVGNLSTPAANSQNFSGIVSPFIARAIHNGSGNLTNVGGGFGPGGGLMSFFADSELDGTGTITRLVGVASEALNRSTGAGAITNAHAFLGQSGAGANGGSGTTTNDFTYRAFAPSNATGYTLTHHYGFHADHGQTGGTGNSDGWAFFVQNTSGADRSQFGPIYAITLALGNFAGGGSIGTAPNTVDVYPSINIAQTTAAQTLTLPSPTLTTAGTYVFINNTGSASFTMLGATVAATQSLIAMWNGAAWSPTR